MIKKTFLFLWINILGLSVVYTLFNLPVLIQRVQWDLSDIFTTKVADAHTEDAWDVTFFLDDKTEWSHYIDEYDNFPWKSYMEDFLAYMDERKLINSNENKKDIKKVQENKWLIIIEDNKVKKKSIFDLSKAMTEDEVSMYGNESWIVIPKIGVKAPIHYPNVEEYDLEWVILKLLEEWVSHRPETQLPDQNGNFFLIGHSSNLPWVKSKYNNIFAWIGKLQEGDIVKVYYKWRAFTYKMYTSFVVPPEAVDVYGYIPWYNLSLMTCFPIGTDKDRLIVRFRLEY